MSRLEKTYVNNRAFATAANAARYLNLSRARITQLINSGTFDALEIGSSVLVPVIQVEAYATRDRKPGRKAKKTEYSVKNDDVSIKEV